MSRSIQGLIIEDRIIPFGKLDKLWPVQRFIEMRISELAARERVHTESMLSEERVIFSKKGIPYPEDYALRSVESRVGRLVQEYRRYLKEIETWGDLFWVSEYGSIQVKKHARRVLGKPDRA